MILGGALVWALPEIIRRVALSEIPKRTGRAVAIDDVDLNLFTGRLAIKKLRLAERNSPDTFAEIERLEARIATSALLRSDIRLADVALVAPSIRVIRTGAGEFNFSDLLKARAEAPPPKPTDKPSRWTLTLDRLRIERGAIRVRDQMVSPAAEWVVQDLGVDAGALTTKAGAAPGRGTLRAKIDEATLDVTAEPLRLDPPKANVKVALTDFELRRIGPYVYAATPYRPKGGRLAVILDATVDQDGDELTKAAVSGTVNLEREAVVQSGKNDPFVGVSRIAVQVREVDVIRRTLAIASVGIEGLDLLIHRDAKGIIDVVEMFTPKTPAGAAAAPATRTVAAPPPPAPVERKLFPVLQALARGFEQIVVDRITLAPSTAMFVDASVKPTTKLALTKLHATVTDLTWPPKGPANLVLATGMPGGGTLEIKGPVVPKPLDADLVVKLRDAPVKPYQAYIPVPAQLSGRFGGDSRHRIVLKDGRMVLTGKGNSWGDNVEIRAPGESRPAIRVERAELVGIDVDWPKRAAVAKAAFRRPALAVEREADGSFDLRKLFEVPGGGDRKPGPNDDKRNDKLGPAPSASPGPPRKEAPRDEKNLLNTMQLDFKQVRIEQGSVRFLDRTTKPAVSQDLSKLEVTATNVNNRRGERAKLSVQSVVGGDATLDVRGEVGAIGSPAFVELAGELTRFQLASVDPYAETGIGWMIKKGELTYKMRFKLDGDAIEAENDVVVGKLQVAPSSATDEVKHRIGLPLGLLVSLVKDGQGEIRANVPVTGSLKDPQFSLRETIWTAVKNVLTNIVKAPFRAIGRLFSGGDKEDTLQEPKVAPVTFAAGSSVIAPDMEEHLLRVADFLRRTPFVNVALSATPSAADTAALRADAVSAHVREFQGQRRLKDGPAVVTAYFRERLPDVKPPPSVEEQLAVLREREPVPQPALEDLSRRRVEATRERLVSAEGIPAERLTVADAKADTTPPAADGAGRVEFRVEARGD